MKEQILEDIEKLEGKAICMLEMLSTINPVEIEEALTHWLTNIIGYSQGAAYLHAEDLSIDDVKEIADRRESAIMELAKWIKYTEDDK